MKPKPPLATYKIRHFDETLRNVAKNGETLPVRAYNKEHAVTLIFGAPAETWEGNTFTKWGTYKGEVVELSTP